MNEQEHEKDRRAAALLQQRREDHAVLPEAVRFENALAIWVRDMRDDQLALVKQGGRLSVPALAYEEVLKLRGILTRFMRDRYYRIQGRWNRRRERREDAGKCESCRWPEAFCTAGRKCVAAGRDGTPTPSVHQEYEIPQEPFVTELYFEAHVTIDPVFDQQREAASALAKEHGFKLAKLIMRKDELSRDDTFMTGHSKSYSRLEAATIELVRTLQVKGYTVRRYKIENTLLDSRTDDVHGLL